MTITRLGAVRYLNTQPLIWGIERAQFPGRFSLQRDVPSRCADALRAGEVDLALLPSIEFARQGGGPGGARPWTAVPGLCISSDGPAASVLLFSRVPFDRVESVAVDSGSRTSVALLRILFRERWSADPAFSASAEEPAQMLAHHDACLVIGDRALLADRATLGEVAVADLGAEWKDLTGLPFVFAFWAGRMQAAGTEETSALHQSLRFGLDRLEEIAASWVWQGSPRPDIVLPYLRDVMQYRFGQGQRDGLLRFYLLAARHGLIEDVPEMGFFPHAAGAAR